MNCIELNGVWCQAHKQNKINKSNTVEENWLKIKKKKFLSNWFSGWWKEILKWIFLKQKIHKVYAFKCKSYQADWLNVLGNIIEVSFFVHFPVFNMVFSQPLRGLCVNVVRGHIWIWKKKLYSKNVDLMMMMLKWRTSSSLKEINPKRWCLNLDDDDYSRMILIENHQRWMNKFM